MTPPVEVLSIGHAGILVRCGDAMVAVDPFLDGEFCWNGNIEQYKGLSPWIGAIGNTRRFLDAFGKNISAICITHAHGDHFDPAAVLAIHERNPRVVVIAPRPVATWIRHAGIGGKALNIVTVSRRLDIEAARGVQSLRVGVLLDPSFPCLKYPSRVGYIVYPPGRAGVAHLGDSHGPDRSWKRQAGKIGGIVTWLRETPLALQSFFSPGGMLSRIWLIHWESFQPGHFDCNLDPAAALATPVTPPLVTGLLSFTDWATLPE